MELNSWVSLPNKSYVVLIKYVLLSFIKPDLSWTFSSVILHVSGDHFSVAGSDSQLKILFSYFVANYMNLNIGIVELTPWNKLERFGKT